MELVSLANNVEQMRIDHTEIFSFTIRNHGCNIAKALLVTGRWTICAKSYTDDSPEIYILEQAEA